VGASFCTLGGNVQLRFGLGRQYLQLVKIDRHGFTTQFEKATFARRCSVETGM